MKETTNAYAYQFSYRGYDIYRKGKTFVAIDENSQGMVEAFSSRTANGIRTKIDDHYADNPWYR